MTEHVHAGVVHLVLDEPRRRNPVTPAFVSQLEDALEQDTAAAVVVSAVAGPVFSSGGDLRLGSDQLVELSQRLYRLYERLSTSSTILIVASDGLTIGAGAQLWLAADLRIAGPDFAIRFSDSSTQLAAGMWGLPSLVGRGRAVELLLCSRTIDRGEADRCGLVTCVSDDPVRRALEMAKELNRLPAVVRERVKTAVSLASLNPRSLRYEGSTFSAPLPSEDQ